MALRNIKELTWRPHTLSDAVDGGHAKPGSMQLLANLIPDPATTDVWVCRPAAVDQVPFPGGTFGNAGFVSCFFVVADIVYGLISTSANPNKDQPFAYDLANNVFLTVSGITTANVPLSPPTTGEWVPPIMDQVAQRIVVCHPGFNATTKFGWFDISSLDITTTGNLQTAVTFTGDTDTGNQPFILGNPVTFTNTGFVFPNKGDPVPVQLGATVTGTGIPANTTIIGVQAVKATPTGALTSGSATIASLAIDGTPSTTGIYVGMSVVGDGIPNGAVVNSINRVAFSMVISANATKTQTSVLSVTGTRLQLSHNTTATNDGVTFTVTNNLITGSPNIVGVQPGMSITGSGVPVGTTVVSTKAISTTIVCHVTDGVAVVQATGSIFGVTVGMTVSGTGVVAGTTVAAIDIPNFMVTLSQPIAGFTGYANLTFTGAAIQVNNTLTGPATGVSLRIRGGTPTAPQWAAGDTMTNGLPSQPAAVAQMNGRAWYACGVNGVVYSDAGFPCQVSNATVVQALLPGNGLPVTCFGKLQLSNLLGGIVQGLIAFQSDANMLQITGDQTTNNLQMNNVPTQTGTHAPLSVFSCQLGVGFISPLGLRFVGLDGRLSPPVGQASDGVTVPFILANNPPMGGPVPPSRICAACNGNTIRISTPTSSGVSYEYWLDLNRMVWSGPHTCPASIIHIWSDTYLMSPVGVLAKLQRSDDQPSATATYVENGARLSWGFGTSLLPDNQAGRMNAMVEATLALSAVSAFTVSVSFVNEAGAVIDTVALSGTEAAPGWGGFSWGGQVWGAQGPAFQQHPLWWRQPIVFKQGRLIAQGQSDASIRIGAVYMRHEILGYQSGFVGILPTQPAPVTTPPAPTQLILGATGQPIFSGATGGPIEP